MPDYREEFKLLLENTFVSSKGDEEYIHKKMTEFLGEVIDNVPERLYRFRRIDESGNAFNSFENGTISCCRPSCFSDKYDSMVFVDVDKEVEVIEGNLKRAMQHVLANIKARNPRIRAERAARVCYMLEQGKGEKEIIDDIIREDYAGFFGRSKERVDVETITSEEFS